MNKTAQRLAAILTLAVLHAVSLAAAGLALNATPAPLAPDGFAAAVTGGGNLTPVIVTTAAAFKTAVESTAPAVITISGTLTLSGGRVSVKSNKTIQGTDTSATVIGALTLSSGVNNVIVRGLNITHPGTTLGADGKYTDGGDGISIDSATNVYITHCTLYDCADGIIDTRLGADNVTISWCKFYYTAAQTNHRFTMISDGNLIRDAANVVIAASTPARMTMHHNWWSDRCDQRMPSSTNGYIHLFNNHWNTPGNYYAALARDCAQFLSENNHYIATNNPLSKSDNNPLLPEGLIRAIGNTYTSCTGTIDPGTDPVFTPVYSYELNATADVSTTVTTYAGNTAGSASNNPTMAHASITGPTTVATGTNTTLTAAPAGFTPASYQWRFKNEIISGATASTFAIPNAQAAAAGSYAVVLGRTSGEIVVSSSHTLVVTPPPAAPAIVTPPLSQSATPGTSITLTTAASGYPSPTFQWRKNGAVITSATTNAYTIAAASSNDAGLYTVDATSSSGTVTSDPAVLGLATTSKVIGAGTEVTANILHPSGNIFDQILLTGAAATITADPGQVTRLSYIDLNNDIVQVEFSGAGSLSLVLENPSGPAPPLNYNQPAVAYMKGHASIVIVGANDTTNVSIFSVGRINAVNQTLFKDSVTYDGLADIASLAIQSANGKFGGARTANTSYFATRGTTGIYAPGVQFTGPVFVGDLSASDTADPVLISGSASDARVAGGDLLQTNSQPVRVSGLTQLKFVAGSTSHGVLLPAQIIKGRLQQNGADVTDQIAVPPAP